jgi:hypothetical protein
MGQVSAGNIGLSGKDAPSEASLKREGTLLVRGGESPATLTTRIFFTGIKNRKLFYHVKQFLIPNLQK